MNEMYLSNVALVSTFYDEKKNYFDVYLPFIVKSLNGQEVCNLEQILHNLKQIFQFGLPISVLKTIVHENEGKCFQSQRKASNWEIVLTDSGKKILARACRVIPIRLEPVCRERERLAPCALRATVP